MPQWATSRWLSKEAQVHLLVDLAAQMKVFTAQHAAGGGKFSDELRGGTLDNFYEDVTGVCGDPDADLTTTATVEAMRVPQLCGWSPSPRRMWSPSAAAS